MLLIWTPLQVWEEALVLFCVENGVYDTVAVKDALRFEKAMRDYVDDKHPELVQLIEEKKELLPEIKEQLSAAIAEFQKNGTY